MSKRLIFDNPRSQKAHDDWRAGFALKQGRKRMLRDLNAKRASFSFVAPSNNIQEKQMARFVIPERLVMPNAFGQWLHDTWRRDLINRMDPVKWKFAYDSRSSIPISAYSSWSLRNAKFDGVRKVGLELPGRSVQKELDIRARMIYEDPELEIIYNI